MAVKKRPIQRTAARPTPQSSRARRTTSTPTSSSGVQRLAAATISRYRGLPGWTPNPVTAFLFLALIRIIGALRSPISDCDETYNYWEPLHYILHGWGFQTWEYAPKFALRSYAFLLPYAALAKGAYAFSVGKISTFYFIRSAQALVHAAAETALYDATVFRFGKERARVFFVLLISSPGTFRAAGELLPSSFAMIALTVAYARWLLGDFAATITYVAVAVLMGWVYVAVVAVPIAVHIMYRRGLMFFVSQAVSIGAPLALGILVVDYRYYNRVVLVPLLHVLYNVFPVPGAGPDIFGVEHWTYYVRNLFLNHPVAAPLVALFPLQSVLQLVGVRVWGSGKEAGTRILFLTPMYILLMLFINVPHKEERFLVPLYPLCALVAAVSLCDWLSFFARCTPFLSERVSDGTTTHRVRSKLGAMFIALATLAVAIAAVALGASRAFMQIHAYSAPLSVYSSLSQKELLDGYGPRGVENSEVNICVGKEWHRFPGNFFLPDKRFRVRFVKDGFHGLLPKYFAETMWGTRVEPEGMNMFNEADPKQWFNPEVDGGCHYYIDLDLSHRKGGGPVEDTNPIPEKSREIVFSKRFLDAELSPPGLRAFYVLGYTDKLVYGSYTVVRNLDLIPFVQ